MKIYKSFWVAATAALMMSTGVTAAAVEKPTACTDTALNCFYSERGVVITKAATQGNELDVMEDAAKRYERYFGTRPARGAVISGEAIEMVDMAQLVLRDKYQSVVPWLTNADKKRLAEYSVRRQIQEQVPDISEADLERSVKASLASVDAQMANSAQETEDGALAHELSHMWFINEYWPNSFGPGQPESAYGGPGPDWLDEMAAVLAENDVLTEGRWKAAKDLDFSGSDESFYPLKEFFTMAHPMAESVEAIQARARAEEGGEDQVEIQALVVTADELEKFEGRNPSIFYTQSRAFADFMIETTGNEQIFAHITAHIVDGGSVDSWLQVKGESLSLPSTVAGLEEAWQAWMRSKLA